MIFTSYDCQEAEGVVLAHTLRLKNRTLKKGKILTPEDLLDLKREGIQAVTGARLEDSDMNEDDAALAMASALGGSHLKISKPIGGRCNLYASKPGLAIIDQTRIDAANRLNTGVTIATLPKFGEAIAEQAVATIKIIPFAVPRAQIHKCIDSLEGITAAANLQPYQPKRAILILTHTPEMKASVLDSTRAVVQQRLEDMGSQIGSEQRCPHNQSAIAEILKQLPEDSYDMILISGASVTVDIGDIVPAAIVEAGGKIEHFGMPVEPGNMLLLAELRSVPIINLPGCGRSPKLNGLDWVMQRLIAGIPINQQEILQMGVGGLIKDIPHIQRVKKGRLKSQSTQPTASNNPQSEQSTHSVAAIVLAAGCSIRMGKQNKLLAKVGGSPMLSKVVMAARASDAQQVVVVTGHESDKIKKLITNQLVITAFNKDYASGMASSLRCGLNALSPDMEGALILLGDMPFITTELINELIAEFNPNMDRDIVAPFKDGRRGNPVIWSRRYFPSIAALRGDTGARNLLQDYASKIWDVPMDNDAIFVDCDSPKMLDSLNKKAAEIIRD